MPPPPSDKNLVPADFEACTLKRGEDGDASAFLTRVDKKWGASDMISVSPLTKEAILLNLRKRFLCEIVYSYVGDIIVSLNPFKNTGCVGKSIRQKYKGKGGGSRAARGWRAGCACAA